jgi:hypothetical protein
MVVTVQYSSDQGILSPPVSYAHTIVTCNKYKVHGEQHFDLCIKDCKTGMRKLRSRSRSMKLCFLPSLWANFFHLPFSLFLSFLHETPTWATLISWKRGGIRIPWTWIPLYIRTFLILATFKVYSKLPWEKKRRLTNPFCWTSEKTTYHDVVNEVYNQGTGSHPICFVRYLWWAAG